MSWPRHSILEFVGFRHFLFGNFWLSRDYFYFLTLIRNVPSPAVILFFLTWQSWVKHHMPTFCICCKYSIRNPDHQSVIRVPRPERENIHYFSSFKYFYDGRETRVAAARSRAAYIWLRGEKRSWRWCGAVPWYPLRNDTLPLTHVRPWHTTPPSRHFHISQYHVET